MNVTKNISSRFSSKSEAKILVYDFKTQLNVATMLATSEAKGSELLDNFEEMFSHY